MKLLSCMSAAVVLALTPAWAGDAGTYKGPQPDLAGWQQSDPATWSPNRAATAAELVAPLFSGALETLEGKPDIKVHVWKSGGTFRAAVRARGLADDSVQAEESVIAIKRDGSGWVVAEVWRRWMCARGPGAGTWTNESCP